jgi:anthranilate 1,2-dioxygenase large subunit
MRAGVPGRREGLTRVPYWLYTDRDLYAEEQERIFRGNAWTFLCLEAELPAPNTFRLSNLGDMPVVVTRDRDGAIHAFENRCAHRGSLLCLKERGEAKDITCVYHNWTYDLTGKLTGVAFRRGIAGKGGMPAGRARAAPAAHRNLRRPGVRHARRCDAAARAIFRARHRRAYQAASPAA